jgi:Icc-related predicted phosphoesterase
VDAALVCGDFSNFEQQYEPLFDSLSREGCPVFFVSGNHESPNLCEHIEAQYGAVCLDYSTLVWQGILFVGVGGYDIFQNQRRRHMLEQFAQTLWNFQISPQPKFSILLSHEPPWPWKYDGEVRGSKDLRRALKSWKFDLVVVGHYHVDIPRLETEKAICPTFNPSFNGCLVNIDLATRQFTISPPFERG